MHEKGRLAEKQAVREGDDTSEQVAVGEVDGYGGCCLEIGSSAY